MSEETPTEMKSELCEQVEALLDGARARGEMLVLNGVDLRRTILRGADLRGVILNNADLRGASMEGALLPD